MAENLKPILTNVRLDPGLKKQIADIAWADRRSMNSLIAEIIKDYVQDRLNGK